MVRTSSLFLFAVAGAAAVGGAAAWSSVAQPTYRRSTATTTTTPFVARPTSSRQQSSVTALQMALDYNDPAVAEEFATVQTLTYEDVAEELLQSGVRAPPTMTEMDVKLMLVELRMQKKGIAGKKKAKPATFSSPFEEALWEKPMFATFYEDVKAKGDHNAMNVVAEYVNHPDMAKTRYYKDYKRLIDDCQAALVAKAPVTSPTITFKGFPANMGEMGCKMTLEAVGPVVDFECTESDDFPVLVGKVTFEDVETAERCIDQYDGMDMGMGETLEMVSV